MDKCCLCNIKGNSNFLLFEDDTYCIKCYNNNFFKCSNCNEVYRMDDDNPYTENGRYVLCQNCYYDYYFRCYSCGHIYPQDHMFVCDPCDHRYCESCFDEDNHNSHMNPIEENTNTANEIEIPFKIGISKTFRENPYKNTCGVELETINQNRKPFNAQELIGYDFNQVFDGSLNSNGLEFSSNAFNGDLLLEKINTFCGELKKRQYKVDTSCGFHLHIKISKNINYLKKVLAFYSKYEDFFFMMLPKSRQNNNYCARIPVFFNNLNLLDYKDLFSLKSDLYKTKRKRSIKHYEKEKYNSCRYCWINFHSLFYRGTLEIRSHNGTIDYDKIRKWILIHLRVLNLLEKTELNIIKNLPKSKEFFLSLFDYDTRIYIIKRMNKFNAPEINGEINHIIDKMELLSF